MRIDANGVRRAKQERGVRGVSRGGVGASRGGRDVVRRMFRGFGEGSRGVRGVCELGAWHQLVASAGRSTGWGWAWMKR